MTIKILPFLCLFGVSQAVAQLYSPFHNQSPLHNQAAENQRQIQEQNNLLIRQQTRTNTRQQQQEMLAEIDRDVNETTKAVSYEFPEIKTQQSQNFKTAMTELTDMLAGNQTMSLKRAVFLSENAYFDNTLNYEHYCGTIDMEVDVIQAFMKKEGYAPDNDMAKKYLIQRLLADTLVMRDAKGRVQFTHLPYTYDFKDPFGTTDYRKMFVTKLLAEKSGQCHSLPLLYLILAEALDVKAWLAYGPHHSYIKVQDNKNAWFNYETTNGHYSSDSWLLSSGYVTANALKNRIYMDTLSTQQTIAASLVDLTQAYIRRCGYDKFVLDAVNQVLAYYPNNIVAQQIRATYYTNLCQYVLKQLNFPPRYMINNFPQAEAIYNQVLTQYSLIDKSGFQLIPDNVYQNWLKSFETERLKRPVKAIRP